MILVDLHNRHLKIRKSRSRVFKRLPINRRGQTTTQVSWLPKQQLSLELHSTLPKYNWRSVLVKQWVLNISVVIGKSFSLFICNYYNTSWVILLIFPVRVTKTILWCISHTRVLWIFQTRLLKKIRCCQLYLHVSGYFCTQKCSQFYDTIWKKFNNTLLILYSYKIILKLHGNLDLYKLLGCDLSLRFLILGLT